MTTRYDPHMNVYPPPKARRRASGKRWMFLAMFVFGCAKHPAPPPPLPAVDVSGSVVRGKSFDTLTLMLPWYGIRNWTWPMTTPRSAGSPFGKRKDPISGKWSSHNGQDIGCTRGEPIFAVADGTVKISRKSPTAGKYIEVTHPGSVRDSVVTRYLHLSRRGVREGRTVKRGQRIGRCGSTGYSTGPHLHFGLVVDGVPKAPFGYLLP